MIAGAVERYGKKELLAVAVIFLLINPCIANKVYLLVYVFALLIGYASVPNGFILYIVFYTKLFGLYSNELQGGTNIILFKDAAFFIAFGILLRWFTDMLNSKFRVSKKYFFWIIVFMCTLFSGVFVANIRWGQPIFKSVITFRVYLPLLIIFPLADWMKNQRVNFHYFMEVFSNITIIVCLILLIQYYIFPNKMLVQVAKVTSDRVFSNGYRFLIHSSSQWMTLIAAYNYYVIRSRTCSGKYVNPRIAFWLILIVLLGVAQTKMYIASLFMTIILIELFFIRNNANLLFRMIKICCAILLPVCVFASMFSPGFSKWYIDLFKHTGNPIRIRAFDFFWDSIKDAYPFFGGGITNTSYPNSPQTIGLTMNCTLSDLGIWGFYYQFGMQGCLALFKCYLLNISTSKKKNESLYYFISISSILIILQMLTVAPDLSIFIYTTAAVLALE